MNPDEYKNIKNELQQKYKDIKDQSYKDLIIDEFELDRELIRTPMILMKYSDIFNTELINLKQMYGLKEKIKHQRWIYYSGKANDKTYAKEPLHITILKSDVEKYMSADDRLSQIDELISIQKGIVDYIEKCIKEIQSRNFHIKSIIDWRKFQSGSGY